MIAQRQRPAIPFAIVPWLEGIDPIGTGAGAVLVVCAVMLGGGTHSGFLSDAILQLVAIGVLFIALRRWDAAQVHKAWRVETLFLLVILLLPVLQLLPLPDGIWAALPGGALRLDTMHLIGRSPGWSPLSLTPNDTILGLLAMLPPTAMLLLMMTLSYPERRILTAAVVIMGLVSVFMGLLQLAEGEGSVLRLYPYTNPSEAVGFFANRNHLSALLYVVLLFAAVWTMDGVFGSSAASGGRQTEAKTLTASLAGFAILFVLLSGEFMARSRAGLGITIVALTGSLVLAMQAAGPSLRRWNRLHLLVAGGGIVAFAALQFAIYRIMDRFAFDPLEDSRFAFYRETFSAAYAHMPWGTGLGSFVRVYAVSEHMESALAGAYVNHAHNDFLELWLETGAAGVLFVAAFLSWLSWRTLVVWASSAADQARLDLWLGRAASIGVVLLLLHSLVDYPLRTGAMSVVLAICCGLLIEPVAVKRQFAPQLGQAPRPSPPATPAPASLAAPASANTPPRPPETQDSALWKPVGAWPAQWGTSPPARTAEPDPGPGTAKPETGGDEQG